MTEWLKDVRYVVRMIAKRPGTSAIAIVALALGIGLTTTMFSIVQGVILRGLPFEASDRIMFVARATVKEPARRDPWPLHDFVDLGARQTSLDSVAAYAGAPAIVAGDTALPERLRGVRVTANLMRVLRVAPVAGRDLTEADAAPGAPAVALISYRQWQSRFGGRPDAIGAVIRLNNQPATVVGVMPEKFGFPEAEDVWMPLSIELPAKRGEGQRVNIIGRLRDGKAVGASRAEFAGLAQQLATEHPENKDVIARVDPFIDRAIPQAIRTTFFTMMGAVLGVMLIACVERHQSAARARRGTNEGVRGALGARIGTVANPAPIAHRRAGAVAGRRGNRRRAREHRHGLLHARDCRYGPAVLDRRPRGRHRAALRHRGHRRDGARFEPRARTARRAAST